MKKLLFIVILFASCRQNVQSTEQQADGVSDIWTIAISPSTAEDFDAALRKPSVTALFDSVQHKKSSGMLQLHLNNGTSLSFKDNNGTPHDEDWVQHSYIGQQKELGKYIVAQHLYEGLNCLYIDQSTGRTDTFNGVPLLSPDHKLLFSTAFNPYEEYEHMTPPTQDIQLATVENGAIRKVFQHPYKMFINNYTWISNNSLIVKYQENENAGDKDIRYAILIVKHEASATPEKQVSAADNSKAWEGIYNVSVEVEETTTTATMISYTFDIKGGSARLKTETTHEPIRCNGKYKMIEEKQIVHLYYDGDDAACKRNSLPFDIKKEAGKYYIRGVGGESTNRTWIILNKMKR